MDPITRRRFLSRTAGTLAGGLALSRLGPLSAAGAPETLPATKLSAGMTRTLGNTGITCSLLGMGTGVHGWNRQSDLTRKGMNSFFSLLEHARTRGITYFDLADMYGSHGYVKEALKSFMERDKVMLLTKTVTRNADGVREDLDRFRKELDTDYLDIVLLHCLTQPGWPDAMKDTMDVLEEAKQKGVIRAHGVSCHNFECMVEASRSPWVDVILARINPFQVKMDNTPEKVAEVLRTCHESGKGVLGMKIVGEGELTDRIQESLNYVLTLGCVDAITVGFLEAGEIDDVVEKIAKVEV